MNFKIPENIKAIEWQQRYNAQPKEVQLALDELSSMKAKQYQLLTLKKSKAYPNPGDAFVLSPLKDIYFVGKVVKNHISNKSCNDILTVFIFKNRYNSLSDIPHHIAASELLIPPAMVWQGYWTAGLFMPIESEIQFDADISYGFYNLLTGKYENEYEQELPYKPDISEYGGIATISGIALRIRRELIIHPQLSE